MIIAFGTGFKWNEIFVNDGNEIVRKSLQGWEREKSSLYLDHSFQITQQSFGIKSCLFFNQIKVGGEMGESSASEIVSAKIHLEI